MKLCECQAYKNEYLSFHMHESWCPMADEEVSLRDQDTFQSGAFFEEVYEKGLDYSNSDYFIDFSKRNW